MSEQDDRPKVTMENLNVVRYLSKECGWVASLSFKKDGENGVIKFGHFKTRDEAREFVRELKNSQRVYN